jgi:hypothetical protein
LRPEGLGKPSLPSVTPVIDQFSHDEKQQKIAKFKILLFPIDPAEFSHYEDF